MLKVTTTNILGLILLLTIWGLSAALLANPTQIPTPVQVVNAALLHVQSGELLINTWASLLRLLVGFAAAVAIGVPLAVLLGLSRLAHATANPIVEFFRPIPAIAWAPFLLVAIGVSAPLYYAVTFYGSIFPIIINTISSIRRIDPNYIHASNNLGASRIMTIAEVILPAALPGIVTGMRVGLGTGLISIVAAELIASNQGLGFMIVYYQTMFDSASVFVGMITIGALGALLNGLLRLIERWGLRWAAAGVLG